MKENNTNSYCCDPFKWQFADRYEAGIYIFARVCSSSSTLDFRIGFRCVPRSETDSLLKEMKAGGLQRKISITQTMALHFCPWCGSNLAKFYLDKANLVVDSVLSEDHM